METRTTPRNSEQVPDRPPPSASSQPSLFPDPPPPPLPSSDQVQYRPGELAPVWLQRINLFIQVMFCIYLGIVVTALPWWPALWDRNLYLLAHPHLWAFCMAGPVRGVISGLGLLDIWVGLSAAVNYRDVRPPSKRERHP